ncbi:MAG: elongation factor G, partial [Pseudomonadota bacterium]
AEARKLSMSVEVNAAHADYLGERWYFLDCPGSVELTAEAQNALMGADIAVVVAEPDPDKVLTLAPTLHLLDEFQIPHLVFCNKIDRSSHRLRDVMAAFQTVSSRPMVLRQVPLREGDQVTGAVDLVSERAWKYRPHAPSELIEIPDSVTERSAEARQDLLEALADFDDGLLEQLLEDKVPATKEVFLSITKDLAQDLIVPIQFGSALNGNGIQRLMKTLRHDAPGPEATAERLGLGDRSGLMGSVIKTYHMAHTGKLSLARIWNGTLSEGITLGEERPAGLYSVNGTAIDKTTSAVAGDLVALGRMDGLTTGDVIADSGPTDEIEILKPEPPVAMYAKAIRPDDRKDEVKLTEALQRLVDEDPSLGVEQRAETHELILWGQGEQHLNFAMTRLKEKWKVSVSGSDPLPPYKETIRGTTRQHTRYKRQSGGHGQFADIQIEVRPLSRGEGFVFEDKIVGGAVPRQFIPAVQHGIEESMVRGPLGFPVVDVSAKLFDGKHHAVDSSEMAFKTAGRQAMSEALAGCKPVLLEPIFTVKIAVPSDFTNKAHGLLSSRRGQIMGFDAKPGWEGWDEINAFMPQAELQDLIVELRSLTQGTGTFTAEFDHLKELTGQIADSVVRQREDALADG